MNAKIALLVAMATWCALPSALRAGQDSDHAPTEGKALLLASERVLEGEVERIGNRFRVRRGASEVWIPADQAICLCGDIGEAFARMKTRANLGDPDERLRLAKWCMANKLPDEALQEARYALEMRPDNAASKNLVAVLERSAKTGSSTPPLATEPKKVAASTRPPAPVDIAAESLSQFTQKVQPILMNTCAGCHATGRGGEFHLSRTFEGGHRAATQRNLAAVLAQVRVEKPALSPLLIKAVSAHGDSTNPPIKSQETVPFRTLTEWIDRTLATNPHLRERSTIASASAASQAPNVTKATSFQAVKASVTQLDLAGAGGPARTQAPMPQATTSPMDDPAPSPRPQADRTAPALDPFDPEIFNRQMHPK